MIEWIDDLSFEVGGIEFHTLGDDLEHVTDAEFHVRSGRPSTSRAFTLQKTSPMVERYVEVVTALAPRTILEIGIFKGGGTALLTELAKPDRIVAVELSPERIDALDEWVRDRGFEDRVRTFFGISQADVPRIREIVNEQFDGPIDLVIDDASHLLDESRVTFNTLFPLVRPGGIYVLEDWGLAQNVGLFTPANPPLTNLLLEIQYAWGAHPELVAEIVMTPTVAFIRRGDLELDPVGFDVRATLAGGQDLLYPPT